MHITGPEDGPPCKVGVAMTDLATGLYAHGAILAALIHREQTGRGQKIDCSLLATQIASLANVGSNYLNGGQEGKRCASTIIYMMSPRNAFTCSRYGSAHASIVPYETFRTRDGWMTIGCGNDRQYRNFCERIGRPDLGTDARFGSNELRVKNRRVLVREITNTLETKTLDEWNETFRGVSFAYGAVNTIEKAFKDEQVTLRIGHWVLSR
jgi:succinate--hydroxymethylglutarate CoA-transferase